MKKHQENAMILVVGLFVLFGFCILLMILIKRLKREKKKQDNAKKLSMNSIRFKEEVVGLISKSEDFFISEQRLREKICLLVESYNRLDGLLIHSIKEENNRLVQEEMNMFKRRRKELISSLEQKKAVLFEQEMQLYCLELERRVSEIASYFDRKFF